MAKFCHEIRLGTDLFHYTITVNNIIIVVVVVVNIIVSFNMNANFPTVSFTKLCVVLCLCVDF